MSAGVEIRTSQECSLSASRHRLRPLQHESIANKVSPHSFFFFFLCHWQQISFPVRYQLSKREPGNPVPLKYNLCNIKTQECTRPHQQSRTVAVSSISIQLRIKKRQEGKGKYNLRHAEPCALPSSRLCCKAKTRKRTHGLKLVADFEVIIINITNQKGNKSSNIQIPYKQLFSCQTTCHSKEQPYHTRPC